MDMPIPADAHAEVIATFGRHLLLEDAAGRAALARPRGRNLDIVCGDRVRCEPPAGAETVVAEVLPRSAVLRRSNLRGRPEALVANLTQLAPILAPLPRPDPFIIDRYLAAARSVGVQALLALNKQDLPTPDWLEPDLHAWRAAGYAIFHVSARDPASLVPPRERLAGEVTALVGQSGVGKSSLIRALARPGHEAEIGELMRQQEGRHTTTVARLYECTTGGRIIDSPGVRDFAPAIDDLGPPGLGFTEVQRLAGGCRFQDCRHMQEPQCAVRAAVDSGQLDARRYESYRRLRRLYEELWDKRPESERARRQN
jgi:ribosome biogenesis GTPase / thiamine phosphate phosphatase